MTEISSTERIRWQRQAHALLGRLLEQGAKYSRPAIAWTVAADVGATLQGECLAHPYSLRREHFEIWAGGITQAAGRGPDHNYEHTLSGGETRLVAQWARVPVRAGQDHPTVRVAITASIWPDVEDEER